MLTDMNRMTKAITAIMVMAILTGLLLSAGCFNERTAQTDVVVYKTDSNGTVEWITNLDTGMQDSGDTIIETSGGGYLVAGGISNNPEGHLGRQIFPRLVKLDKSGTILWDTVLNSTSGTVNYTDSGGATTVLEKPDGDFLAGLDNGGVLMLNPGGTVKNSSVLDNRRLSVIATDDGGILFVGEKSMKFDATGNLTWEKNLKRSTLAFQTSDGRYLLDTDTGTNTIVKAVTCLAPNGTTLWTYELGNWPEKTATSFYESTPGVVDFTYSFMTFENGNSQTYSVTTEQLSFDQQGTVIAIRNLSAAGPLVRTSDNGYTFVANPFSDSGKFTTDYSKNTILHIVKLSADGTSIWDRPLTPAGYNYPRSIITTSDGGYAALVMQDVHDKS
jgi:hypothetical protein